MKLLNPRKLILAVADILIILSGTVFSIVLSGQLGISHLQYVNTWLFIALNIICCFFSLLACGAYSKVWRNMQPKDYYSCLFGIIGGIIMSYAVNMIAKNPVNVICLMLCFTICLAGICLFRLVFRNTFLKLLDYGRNELKKRTLIVGAGQACRLLLTELKNADHIGKPYPYNPICIIDDDITKLHNKIEGVPIIGTSEDLVKCCLSAGIETILFAIPSCSDEKRKDILNLCYKTNCEVKIIPEFGQVWFNGNIITQFRDIKIEDLLGRPQITFDNTEVAEFVKGQVCMVTGGGGSIGSELVRQIAKYSPKQIIILDIYENNAYDIQQELVMTYGRELNLKTLIASVRDYDKLDTMFDKYRPDIVFHAAAHKHVPLMETSPEEAVKNNVEGTYNVAQVADKYGVKRFVMISTDKAVNPTNVMGATKRCCEMIIQYMSQKKSKTEFVAVRFGNVLGSNGSVIPLFRKQLETGKPITVTHPDIIRYFMTIPEAVSLVLQAGAIAKGGEIFVLDMGSPVRIVELAENLIRMYGKVPYEDVDIVFTGLRPGEKLYEELLMNEEGLTSTPNKKIFIGSQIEIDCEEFQKELSTLRYYAHENNTEMTLEMLQKIVPTFNHNGGLRVVKGEKRRHDSVMDKAKGNSQELNSPSERAYV